MIGSRIVLALSAIWLSAAATAMAAPLELQQLTLNGVAPGMPTAQAQHVLGRPAAIKGSHGQFLIYRGKGAWGALTLELSTDGRTVAFIDNGSSLTQDGAAVLKIGDSVAQVDKILVDTPHDKREKVDSWEYVCRSADRLLVVVIKEGRVADFVLGVPSGH